MVIGPRGKFCKPRRANLCRLARDGSKCRVHSSSSGSSGTCPRLGGGALLLALCCALTAACGFHSDLAGLGRLRARIHDEVGTDASVNVHSAYGQTTVTIRLEHQPPGDPKQVQAQVEALAKAEFPQTDYVVVLSQL